MFYAVCTVNIFSSENHVLPSFGFVKPFSVVCRPQVCTSQRRNVFRLRSFLATRRTDDREMSVSCSISLGLLLVTGRSSWLQMRSLTIWMFTAVLADRGRPLPLFRPVLPVSSIRLIKSHNVLFFHFRHGNSRIILSAVQPFATTGKFTFLSASLYFSKRGAY